ncbi:MAG: hypothetical protein R2854_03340 [Caldilineaceae bacterium]
MGRGRGISGAAHRPRRRVTEDPALLTLLRSRRFRSSNPTSNICLHVYRRLAEHPLPHLDRMGLVVTVNSDDPPLFNTRLLDEYAVLALESGYDKAGMARLRNAFAVAGVEEEIVPGCWPSSMRGVPPRAWIWVL